MRKTHRCAALVVLLLVSAGSFVWSETDEEMWGCFVERQYGDVLGRPFEAEGKAFWLEHLYLGTLAPEEVAAAFVGSAEFQDTVGFIARCYFAIFNNNLAIRFDDPLYRVPDHGGLVFWSGVMRDFLDADDSVPDEQVLPEAKRAVVLGFIGSGEWQERVGDINDSAFVEFLYENILGRASDTGGHAFWLDLLQGGVTTRENLVLDFIDSPEARERYANHSAVVMCYLGFLGRAAEQDGFVYWMNQTNAGLSIEELISGFIYSAEYEARVGELGCSFPPQLGDLTVGPHPFNDYAAIQPAIDAATSGTEIVVFPGRYVAIGIARKDIHLRSTNPQDWDVVKATIIDATGIRGSAVYLSEVGRGCIVEGFTITGGTGTYFDYQEPYPPYRVYVWYNGGGAASTAPPSSAET